MKFVYLGLIVVLLLATPSMAQTPPGSFIGDFLAGESFYTYTTPEGYKVVYSFRGIAGESLLILMQTSPENLKIPDGYAYISMHRRLSYYVLKFPGFSLNIAPYIMGNYIKVYKE